jgi:hypothetical protein
MREATSRVQGSESWRVEEEGGREEKTEGEGSRGGEAGEGEEEGEGEGGGRRIKRQGMRRNERGYT